MLCYNNATRRWELRNLCLHVSYLDIQQSIKHTTGLEEPWTEGQS
jgi:hypothetical protein